MAINRILNPVAAGTPPTITTGYTYQNNVIEVLGQKSPDIYPTDYANNIVKGYTFKIQGVWYRADSTTAITGTESYYIKITPSGATASASYVSSLSGVSWDDDYNDYYDASGNLYIFDEIQAAMMLEISQTYRVRSIIATDLDTEDDFYTEMATYADSGSTYTRIHGSHTYVMQRSGTKIPTEIENSIIAIEYGVDVVFTVSGSTQTYQSGDATNTTYNSIVIVDPFFFSY